MRDKSNSDAKSRETENRCVKPGKARQTFISKYKIKLTDPQFG